MSRACVLSVFLTLALFISTKASAAECFGLPPTRLALLDEMPEIPVKVCFQKLYDVKFGEAKSDFIVTHAGGKTANLTVPLVYENDPLDDNKYPVTDALIYVTRSAAINFGPRAELVMNIPYVFDPRNVSFLLKVIRVKPWPPTAQIVPYENLGE